MHAIISMFQWNVTDWWVYLDLYPHCSSSFTLACMSQFYAYHLISSVTHWWVNYCENCPQTWTEEIKLAESWYHSQVFMNKMYFSWVILLGKIEVNVFTMYFAVMYIFKIIVTMLDEVLGVLQVNLFVNLCLVCLSLYSLTSQICQINLLVLYICQYRIHYRQTDLVNCNL